MVCLPKEEGGLGVINLKTHIEALLLKNLHKFYNKLDIPWVNLVWEKHYRNGKLPSHIKKGSFWWRDNLKLLDSFKGMAMVNIQNGSSYLFWSDLWGDRCNNNNNTQSFSPLQEINSCPSKQFIKQNRCIVSFIYLGVRKLFHN